METSGYHHINPQGKVTMWKSNCVQNTLLISFEFQDQAGETRENPGNAKLTMKSWSQGLFLRRLTNS